MPIALDERRDDEMVLAFLAESGEEYTSGDALSGKLGLSRAAVYKSVESLRHQGYRIEAVPARGYRLVEIPDRLSDLELFPLLGTHDVARSLTYIQTLPSTNAEAFRLAGEGVVHGHAVIAEAQTAGKGRRGRTWASPPGLNLYLSVVLRPDLPAARAPELTLLAAVALTETLRDAGAKATIKWPNDVQVEGRKIAGALTELSTDDERVGFVVLGIGVNLNATPADFPSEVSALAVSLREVTHEPVVRARFAAAFLTRLEEWLDLHQEVGFEPVRAAWKQLSGTLGERVQVSIGERQLVGIAEDIDDAGALMVRTESGVLERVLAGDVEQLRAQPPR